MLILYATRRIPGILTIEGLSVLPHVESLSKCANIDDYRDEVTLLATEGW